MTLVEALLLFIGYCIGVLFGMFAMYSMTHHETGDRNEH
jgi:hypothetical protein